MNQLSTTSIESKSPPSKMSSLISMNDIEYRRALSNPNWHDTAEKLQEAYEQRLTQSLPQEFESKFQAKKNFKRPSEIDRRLSEALLNALMPKDGIDSFSFGKSYDDEISSRKKRLTSKFKPKKHIQPKLSRNKVELNSLDTPTFGKPSFSDNSIGALKSEDEYPLYRVLNEAISDVSNILSLTVLKKVRPLKRRSSKQGSQIEDISNFIPTDVSRLAESASSQAHLLTKNISVNSKPLPGTLSKSLKQKCSLWRIKNSGEPATRSSMFVNPSTDSKDGDTQDDARGVFEDDEVTIEQKPSNNMKLVQELMYECSGPNTFHRQLKKRAIPYTFNVKDYNKLNATKISRLHFKVLKLTGSDIITLNRRTTMIQIAQSIQENFLSEVAKHQDEIMEKEEHRVRELVVHGLVRKSYNETDDNNDKWRTAEKPHIAYNSIRPIFNENPLAVDYKAIYKEIHRDVVLKSKEESEVASIGQVSFVSDSSSIERNFKDDDTLNSTQWVSRRSSLKTRLEPSNATDNEICKYLMQDIQDDLNEIDGTNTLEKLFKLAELFIHPPRI